MAAGRLPRKAYRRYSSPDKTVLCCLMIFPEDGWPGLMRSDSVSYKRWVTPVIFLWRKGLWTWTPWAGQGAQHLSYHSEGIWKDNSGNNKNEHFYWAVAVCHTLCRALPTPLPLSAAMLCGLLSALLCGGGNGGMRSFKKMPKVPWQPSNTMEKPLHTNVWSARQRTPADKTPWGYLKTCAINGFGKQLCKCLQ